MLERLPPQLRMTVGDRRRDEDREGAAVSAEHRPGMKAIVAIAVIESEHGDRLIRPAPLHHFHRLLERCQSIALTLDMTDDGIEELRCDLELGIGRKATLRRGGGKNVMQHENDAETSQCRRQEPGSAACPDNVEAGAIEGAPADHAFMAIGGLPSLAITKRAARTPAAVSEPQSSAASWIRSPETTRITTWLLSASGIESALARPKFISTNS